MTAASECVFCRIVSRTAPASIVIDTGSALAFMDINQPTPGHVLIIPHTHVPDIYTLDDASGAEVFALTSRVARAVKTAFGADGINLWQSNGRAAGQEVFHFHMHIIARYVGDRDRIQLGFQRNLPHREEIERLAAQIKEKL